MAAPDAAQACIQVEQELVEVQEDLPDVSDMPKLAAGVPERGAVWLLVKTHGGGMERGSDGGPGSAACNNNHKEAVGSEAPFSIRNFVASVREADVKETWPFTEGLLKWRTAYRADQPGILPSLDSSPLTRLRSVEKNLKQLLISEETDGEELNGERTDETEVQIDPFEIHCRRKSPLTTPISDRAENLAELVAEKQEARKCGPPRKGEPHAMTDVAQFSSGTTPANMDGVDILVESSGTGVYQNLVGQVTAMELDKRTNVVTEPEDALMMAPLVEICKEITKFAPIESNGTVLKNHRVEERSEIVVGSELDSLDIRTTRVDANHREVECRRVCNGFEEVDKVEVKDSQSGPKLPSQNGAYHERDRTCTDTSRKTPVDLSKPCGMEEYDDKHSQIHDQDLEETSENMMVPKVSVAKFSVAICKERSEVALESGKGVASLTFSPSGEEGECPVCRTFTSPSNTALNAHIDQCLVDAPAQSVDRSNGQASGRIQKFKVKAQKKRSLADLCALAPRRDLEDSGKSHSASRESSPAGAENEVVGPIRRDGEVRRQPRTPFFRDPMGGPKKVRCSQGNAGVVRSQGPTVKDPDDLQRAKKPRLLSDSKCTQQEYKRPMSDVDQRDSRVQVRKKRRRIAGKPGYGNIDSRSNISAGFTETSSMPLHGQNSSGTSANKPSPLLQAVFSNSKVTSNLEDSKVRIKEKKRADGEELSRFGKKADAGDNTSEELALDVVEPAASNQLDGSASARCLGSESRHSSSPGADKTLLCQGTKGASELKTTVGSGQCPLTVSPRASGGSKISSPFQPSGGPKKKRVRLSTTASIPHNWKSGSTSMVGVKANYKKFHFNLPPKLSTGQESPRNEQTEAEGWVGDHVEPSMKETTCNPSNKEPNVTGSTDFPSAAKNAILPKQNARPLQKSPVSDSRTPDDRILQQPVDAGKKLVSPITKSLGRSEWRKDKLKRKRPRLPNTPKDAPILIPRSNAILREVLGLKQYFGQAQASLPSHTREPVGISTENQSLDTLHHSVSTGKRQLSESSTRLHLGKRTETRKGSELFGGPHETAAEAQRLGGRDIAIGLAVNNAHEVSEFVEEIEEVMVDDLNNLTEARDPTANLDIRPEASSAKLVSPKPTVKGAFQQAYNTTKGKKAPIKVAARSLSGPINSKDITEPAKKLIVPPRGPGGRFISPKVVNRDPTAGDATDGLSYTQSEHTPNSTSKVHKTKAYSKLGPTLLSPGAFRPQRTPGGNSANDLAVDPLGWSEVGIGGSIVQEPQLPSSRSSIAADDNCGSGQGTDRMVPIIQGTATEVDVSALARKGNLSSPYSRDVSSPECCNGGTATRASSREGTAEQSQSNSSQPSETNPAVLNQAQTIGLSQLTKGCTSRQPVHGVTSPLATPHTQVISSSETSNGGNKGIAVVAEKSVTPGDAQVARLPGWMLAALTDQQQLPLGSAAEVSKAPHVGRVLAEVNGQDGGRATVPPSPETLNFEHAEPGMVKLFGNPVLRLMGRNVLVLQEENPEDLRSSKGSACGTESSSDLQAGKLLGTSAPPTDIVGQSGMATVVFHSPGAATAGWVKEVDLLKGSASASSVHKKKSSLNHPASLRPQEAGGEVLVVPWHAGDANQRVTTAATSSRKIGEPDLRLHTKTSRKGRNGDIELRPGTSLGCLDLTSSLGSLTPSMVARGENANSLAIHNKVRRASSSNGPAPGQEVIVIDDLPGIESPRRAAKHVTLSVETLMKVGALRPLPSEVDKQTINAKVPGAWGPVMELDCSRIPQLSGVSQNFLLAELRKLGLVPATHVDSQKTAISEQRVVSRGVPSPTLASSTPLPQHAMVSEITTASPAGRLSTLVSATKGAPVSVGKLEVLPPWLLAAKKQKEARMAANLIVLDDEDDPPIIPTRSGLLGSTESQVPGPTGFDSRIAEELFGGTQENSSNEPSSALSEVSLASYQSKGVLKVAEVNMILGSPLNAERSRPSSRPINQSGGILNPSVTTQDSVRTACNSTAMQQPSDLLQTTTSTDYAFSEGERGKSHCTTGQVEQVEKAGKNVDPPAGSGGSVISFLPPSWMVGGNPGAKRGATAQGCKAAVAFLSKLEAAPQVTQLETLGLMDGRVLSGVPQVTRSSSFPLQRLKPVEEALAVAIAATATGDGENPPSHDAAQSMFLKHSMSLQRPRHFTSDSNEKNHRCNGNKGPSLNNGDHEMTQVGTQVLQSHLGKPQQLNQDIVIPLKATFSNLNQALTRSREEAKRAGECTPPDRLGKQSPLGQGRQHPVSINCPCISKDVPDLMTMTPLGMQVARNAFYREKQPSSMTNSVDPPCTTPPISSTTQITLSNSEARCRADNECQAGAVGSMPDLVDDIVLSQALEKPKESLSPSRGLPVGVGVLEAVGPTVTVQKNVKPGACIYPPDLVRNLSAGGDRDVQIEHNSKSPPLKSARGAITGNSVNLQVIARKQLPDPVREGSPAADLKKTISSNSAQPSTGSSLDVFVTEHTGYPTGSERRSADTAAAIDSSAITNLGPLDDEPQPGTRANTSEAARLEHASRGVPSEGILNTGSAPSFPVGQANSCANLRQQSEGVDKLNLAGATAMNASDISTSSPSILDVRKMVNSHPFNVHENVIAMKTGKGVGHWLVPRSAQPLVGTNEEFELFLSSMTLMASHSSDVFVQANIAMPDSCPSYSDALAKAARFIAIALVFLQGSHWEEYWQQLRQRSTIEVTIRDPMHM